MRNKEDHMEIKLKQETLKTVVVLVVGFAAGAAFVRIARKPEPQSPSSPPAMIETNAMNPVPLAAGNQAGPQMMPPTGGDSFQSKMQKFQEAVRRRQQEGRDLSEIGRIMTEFQPLAQAGKTQEAEAVLDRALAALDNTPAQ